MSNNYAGSGGDGNVIVSVRLSQEHLERLAHLEAQLRLPDRTAAIRWLIDLLHPDSPIWKLHWKDWEDKKNGALHGQVTIADRQPMSTQKVVAVPRRNKRDRAE